MLHATWSIFWISVNTYLDDENWLILLKILTHLHSVLPLAIFEDKGPQSIYVQAAANHKTKCTQMCKTFATAQRTQGFGTWALATEKHNTNIYKYGNQSGLIVHLQNLPLCTNLENS